MRLFSIGRIFLARTYSSHPLGNKPLVAGVTITDDKTTFVAWHPKADFPYEFSKPIPAQNKVESSQVIKEKAMQSAMQAFKNQHPEVARQELMRVTYTTKHKWFPRARDKRAKKTEMDRKFL